jgi:hypothetical protein
MNHTDHVALLARGVRQDEGGTWADLGAGTGAFTLALADLIGPHGVIHAALSAGQPYRVCAAYLRAGPCQSKPHRSPPHACTLLVDEKCLSPWPLA